MAFRESLLTSKAAHKMIWVSSKYFISRTPEEVCNLLIHHAVFFKSRHTAFPFGDSKSTLFHRGLTGGQFEDVHLQKLSKRRSARTRIHLGIIYDCRWQLQRIAHMKHPPSPCISQTRRRIFFAARPHGICRSWRVIGGNDTTFPRPKQGGILKKDNRGWAAEFMQKSCCPPCASAC